MTASALFPPVATMVVPSRGSTAMSTRGVSDAPTSSPMKSIGASSRSPSPITTRPLNWTALKALRIAWTAAWSAATLSPRPISLAAARAAASVTRTTSSARFRSTSPPFRGKWLPQSRFREKRIGDTDDLPVAVRECVDGGPVGQKRPVLPFDPVSESDARASKPAHFRADGEEVVVSGRRKVPYGCFRDREVNADPGQFPVLHPHAPHELDPPRLEPLEIVRVVDDPHGVGVREKDPYLCDPLHRRLRVSSRQEVSDEARPGVQELSRRLRIRLGVPLVREGRKAGGGGVKGERHRLLGVGPDGHRGRMVGEQQNGQISPVSGPVEDRRHHLLVDPLDGPDLVRGASVVPRLVGRLHVDQDEILAFQLPEGVLRLPAEVRIDVPRGAGDGYQLQPRIDADAPDEVDRRYHGAREAVFFPERLHPGRFPLPPQPDGVPRRLPRLDPLAVDGMGGKYLTGDLHRR